MRYIYYMTALIMIFTVGVLAYGYKSSSKPPDDPAIIINNKILTKGDLIKMESAMTARDGILDSLIDRELLIQEAVRQGIQKEDAFRSSVKNFYEQSLIKTLIARKMIDINNTTVNDAEIIDYSNFLNGNLRLSILTAKTRAEAEAGKFSGSADMAIKGSDLSETVRGILIGLKEGQTSKIVIVSGTPTAYRINKITKIGETETLSYSDKKALGEALLELKKERLLNEWLAGLRKDADIRIVTGNIRQKE